MSLFFLATGRRLFRVASITEMGECFESWAWLDRLDYIAGHPSATFFQELLVVDAGNRPEASTALAHPWLE